MKKKLLKLFNVSKKTFSTNFILLRLFVNNLSYFFNIKNHG